MTVPGSVLAASVALEFRLSKHEHRYITKGAQVALDSAWDHLPVAGKIQRGLFVASEARKSQSVTALSTFCTVNLLSSGGFCARQEMDTEVRQTRNFFPRLPRLEYI